MAADESKAAPAKGAFPSTAQLERTRALRLAVYRAARLSTRRKILEVGTGEGLVAREMAARTGRRVRALDVEGAWPGRGAVDWVLADAHRLPFRDGTLDAVAFHFVLLWLRDPVRALVEARRVLEPGGAVLILSEPDFTRRRDEPDTGLGGHLARLVERSGGHPDSGAKVAGWLEKAGFRHRLKETPQEWVDLDDPREIAWEIAFLQRTGVLSPEGAEKLGEREREAAPGRRVCLPITYGCGFKGE